jgi:hypothetical protein
MRAIPRKTSPQFIHAGARSTGNKKIVVATQKTTPIQLSSFLQPPWMNWPPVVISATKK